MRRGIAVVWHASSFILAAGLYFFFVLPRWPELTGDVSHTWGTVLRIVTGAVLGLTALPVVFTLLKTRRPEFGTPQLALSLRMWSIIGHVLAGAMIIVTAVVEIWVSLDRAGPWLFAVYGAAAAIAVLSALAFYLAFAAELPPPPPKALKPKKQKAVRGGDGVEDTVAAEDVEAVTAEADDAVADEAVEQTVTAEAARPTTWPTVTPKPSRSRRDGGGSRRPASTSAQPETIRQGSRRRCGALGLRCWHAPSAAAHPSSVTLPVIPHRDAGSEIFH